MDKWKDKVALVTGASSGIGAAIAKSLALAGMPVAVCARRQQRLDELVATIESKGGTARSFTTDICREEQIEATFTGIREIWGGVDVLINNAGVGYRTPLFGGDPNLWREMLDVNILGLCHFTSKAVADMRRRGDRGHVIHIGSMAGHRVPPMGGLYSATKFAVRALTEGLRQELRQINSKIRVSAISPAFVETGFVEKYFGDAEQADSALRAFTPLQSEDVANSVIYALSQPEHVQVHDVLVRATEQVT